MKTGRKRKRLEFFLGNEPVGHFRGRAFPQSPGRIEFYPYRGPGHAELVSALRKRKHADCWYLLRGQRIPFKVIREDFVLGRPGSASNWYLEISGFSGGGSQPHPLAEFVGMFKDDPLNKDWKKSMKAHRRNRDKDADKP